VSDEHSEVWAGGSLATTGDPTTALSHLHVRNCWKRASQSAKAHAIRRYAEMLTDDPAALAGPPR
jgi:hypothetical protein